MDLIEFSYGLITGISVSVTVYQIYKIMREPRYRVYVRHKDEEMYTLHAKRLFQYTYEFGAGEDVLEVFELEDSKKYVVYAKACDAERIWQVDNNSKALEDCLSKAIDHMCGRHKSAIRRKLQKAGLYARRLIVDLR